MYVCNKSDELKVFDFRVPLGVGFQDKSGLRLRGKWGALYKPLAFQVLADTPHACSGGVCYSFPGQGKRVYITDVCWSVGKLLHEMAPGSQPILERH